MLDKQTLSPMFGGGLFLRRPDRAVYPQEEVIKKETLYFFPHIKMCPVFRESHIFDF